MQRVTLFGAAYSVYVRIARMVLEEARVPYELTEVDIFAKEKVPTDYADRHPFGKIPALEHDGFRLFETDAIAAYIVDLSDDRNLVPTTAKDRARTIQIMRIMDHYAYPSLVWGVFVEEVERKRVGQLDSAQVDLARRSLTVLDGLMGGRFLVGEQLTLADLWAYPMFTYFGMAPTGQRLIAEFPRLGSWKDAMDRRPSAKATRFPREAAAGEDDRTRN